MTPPGSPPPTDAGGRARVTLLLGGARSGKSEVAERLITALGPGLVHYVATAVVDPADADLARRVAAHRARRDGRFRTVEAGDDLAGAVRDLPPEPALIDSLGTWLASPAVTPVWAHDGGGAPADRIDAPGGPLDDVLAALHERSAPTVIVSEEAGMGVHPEHAAGRRWRDALGIVNQRVAAVSGDVWLVVAGRGIRLERIV